MKTIFTSTFLFLLLVVNGQISHVVIAAVYGGGSNSGAVYQNDFIELFNPTTTSQTLTNCSVQYSSAGASGWKVQAINAVMPAGSYYLIQLSGNGTVGAALPTADLIGTINLNATTGIIALVNTISSLSGTGIADTTVIDLVGYGATASGYETSPAPGMTNKKCLVRGSGGCTDVGDNSTDFTTSTSFVPQNASSPVNLCNGLPITLVSFVATIVNNNTLLKWETASEINFNKFILEKSNTDNSFIPIAIIASKKLSTSNNYSYIDEAPLQNVQYYRLKMMDNDGSFKYSSVVKLTNPDLQLGGISIYPNPVKTNLKITLSKPLTNSYTIRITTITGVLVYSKNNVTLNGNTLTLETNNFTNGVYVIELTDEKSNVLKGKFVKE